MIIFINSYINTRDVKNLFLIKINMKKKQDFYFYFEVKWVHIWLNYIYLLLLQIFFFLPDHFMYKCVIIYHVF